MTRCPDCGYHNGGHSDDCWPAEAWMQAGMPGQVRGLLPPTVDDGLILIAGVLYDAETLEEAEDEDDERRDEQEQLDRHLIDADEDTPREDPVDRVERLQREADLDAFGASTADWLSPEDDPDVIHQPTILETY